MVPDERSGPVYPDFPVFHLPSPKKFAYIKYFLYLCTRKNLSIYPARSYRYLYILDFVIFEPYLNSIISTVYAPCHNT